MEHEERIRLLLSMQEHPEQYSDEQLQQMLVEDPELTELLDELALTKQAFVKRETDEEVISVEEEWERFVEKKKIGNVENKMSNAVASSKSLNFTFPKSLNFTFSNFQKLAASFIGVLFTVGVAFAAVRIVRQSQRLQAEQAAGTTSAANFQLSTFNSQLETDTLTTDTTATAQPIVFDNTPLEKMLPQIAAYYHKEVEFVNDNARQLRFYFVWKPEEGLEVTLHRLNLFESVNIELKDNKIIVE